MKLLRPHPIYAARNHLMNFLTKTNNSDNSNVDEILKKCYGRLETETISNASSSATSTVDLVNILSQTKNQQEIQRGAAAFHRYLQISAYDVNSSLTLPILDKLWKHMRDDCGKDTIGRWSPEITAEILFMFGKLNRLSNSYGSSAIRRILSRDDIRLLENNIIVNEFQLPLKLIDKSCHGLSKLQMCHEIDNNYPSDEYMSGLKVLLKKEINNESAKKLSIIELTRHVGSIAVYISKMTLKIDHEIVRVLNVLLKKLLRFLLDKSVLMIAPSIDDEKHDTNSSSAERKKQQDALTSAAEGLSCCADAMMNWKLFGNDKIYPDLWNIWFSSCDEILIRNILNAESRYQLSIVDLYFETKLISIMIVSATCYNNEEIFLELLDRIELRLNALAPSMSSEAANYFLLQIKTLENKMIYSKNRNLRYFERFNNDLKRKLRQRCDEKV